MSGLFLRRGLKLLELEICRLSRMPVSPYLCLAPVDDTRCSRELVTSCCLLADREIPKSPEICHQVGIHEVVFER